MSKKTGIKSVEGNTIVIDDIKAFTKHVERIGENIADKRVRKVNIKKAKIKNDLFLEGEYNEELVGHGKKNTKFTCTVPIHEDLKAAFDSMRSHLALLCDQITWKSKKLPDLDDEIIASFAVSGFTVGGSDDSAGVTVIGGREGKYGLFNLNTPFTEYEDGEYPFISELGQCIETAIYEVEQYLFEGKQAPEKQLEIDFDDKEGEETESD